MNDPLSIGHFRRENCRALLDYFTRKPHPVWTQKYANWWARIEAADAMGAEPPPLVECEDVRALDDFAPERGKFKRNAA